MYYIGIDFGGTNISAGIVDEDMKILAKRTTPTKAERHYSEIIKDMVDICKELVDDIRTDFDSVFSIGIGCPGMVDAESGNVIYVNNLKFDNVNIKEEFAKYLNTPVFINNDANCAALGESVAGACKWYKNSITITLGTGIGGGIIIDGKIYNGSFFGSGEIGHMVIEHNGRECTCGRKGCFEAYASTSALTKITKEIVAEHNESEIYTEVNGNIENINTKILFKCADNGDTVAKDIIEKYIDYLAAGITNLVNIFQPKVIAIGGGISAQGDKILKPLTKLVERDVYGGVLKTKLVIATLGNDAGIVGASMLGK